MSRRAQIIRLAAVIAIAAMLGALAASTRIIGGPHPQVVIGGDQTGYVNISGQGILFARGSWEAGQ